MKYLIFYFVCLSLQSFAQVSPTLKNDSSLSFLDTKGIKNIKINSINEYSKIATVEFLLDNLSYNVEIITPISADRAKALINNNFFILLKSFEATPTPYVGQITKVQECSKTSKPVITKLYSSEIEMKLLSFHTDSSLRPGVCVQKKELYEICQTFFYLTKSQSFVKLKSISPKGGSCLLLTQKYLSKLKF